MDDRTTMLEYQTSVPQGRRPWARRGWAARSVFALGLGLALAGLGMSIERAGNRGIGGEGPIALFVGGVMMGLSYPRWRADERAGSE